MDTPIKTISIYEAIKNNPSNELPDHNELTLRNGEEWIPGAYEGILLRSDFSIRQHSLTNYTVARKIKKFAAYPSEKNRSVVEKIISKYSAISLIDPVLSFLQGMQIEPSIIFDISKKLALHSRHREAVKFAIALLGHYGKDHEDAVDIIKVLSGHDEFTIYGIIALKNILPKEEADTVLIELGERLFGWGKIAIMYELDYSLEYVRSWTLQKGCRNNIGLSYLANVCAIKGKLKDYLFEKEMEFEPIDNEYFQGICDIFRGLLDVKSSNDSIYEYPFAVEAANCLRTTLKMSPKEMQDAARDILEQLDQKNIGDPKAADTISSF